MTWIVPANRARTPGRMSLAVPSLVAMATLAACRDGAPARAPASAPHATRAARTGPGAPARTSTSTPPALADSPRIDLLDNRYLWHLYGDGLIVPVAGEGLRKYSLEYTSPWGEVVEIEGRRGRVLTSRKATLRVPAEQEGRAWLRIGVWGGARTQRVTITLNGRRVAERALEPGWQLVTVSSDSARLVAGENEIGLSLAARGKVSGTSTYGLWHSIEVIAADSEPPGRDFPPLSPVSTVSAQGSRRDALAGVPRLAMLVEVPEDAWLRVDTAATQGPATLAIRAARAADARAVTLWDHRQEPGAWQRQHISLGSVAGELVRLELDASPGAAWSEPRILMPRADSASLAPVKNVVLFVVDTLRADRLALYGKTRVTTKHLDDAARRGSTVFPYHQAASPSSPPSHASIHTGSMPRIHGVAGDQGEIKDGTPVLSAIAGAAGVTTGYVGNNNFAMGRLKKPGQWSWFYEPVFNKQGVDCAPLVTEMLRFLDERAQKGRFFLTGLPLEPHVPYRYHEGITDLYFSGPWDSAIGKKPGSAVISRISSGSLKMTAARKAQVEALYDGEVHYLDQCLGTLLQGMDQRGLLDDTAVIVTSDHGEGMYERGRMGHAYGHHAELSNVPFVILWPRSHALAGRAQRLEVVTSHIDIAPTVIDMLGLPADTRMQGKSMLDAIRRGGALPRVVATEYGRSYALRARRWKYIVDYSGAESLHDVAADPLELSDVKAERPLALRYMRDLGGFYLAHRNRWQAASFGDLNNHGPGLVTAAEPR